MTAHVEHFVLHITTTLSVVAEDLMLEALPLSLLAVGIVFLISVIGLIHQAKVSSGLQTLLAKSHMTQIVAQRSNQRQFNSAMYHYSRLLSTLTPRQSGFSHSGKCLHLL